jgi:hypothetical protein
MMLRHPPASQTKLRDFAAIIGALAALAWPIAAVLIRARRIRLTIGSAVLEVDSTARGLNISREPRLRRAGRPRATPAFRLRHRDCRSRLGI